MTIAPLRKGWCPSVLRPMRTGDGLLVRLPHLGGRLSFERAGAIADLSQRFGNGALEISSRGNLQLRGVGDLTLGPLQQALVQMGLREGDAAGESFGNIMINPAADLDPNALCDPAPIASALQARLAGDTALQALPAKFSVVIDASGAMPLGEVDADLRFVAIADGPTQRFLVTLSGDERVSASCAGAELPELAAAVSRAFLKLTARCEPAQRRLRALATYVGAAAIFAEAGISCAMESGVDRRLGDAQNTPSAGLDVARNRDRPGGRMPCAATLPQAYIGAFSLGAVQCVGAAPPLGRMSADNIGKSVRAAQQLGARDVRLTPWRSLIVTAVPPDRLSALIGVLDGCGFILEAADPRLAVVACAGAPACAHAARDVQADASALARGLIVGRGVQLHVSGCEKGCARAAPAPLTLVARDDGYDLILNGGVRDTPIRRGLDIAALATFLTQRQSAESRQ